MARRHHPGILPRFRSEPQPARGDRTDDIVGFDLGDIAPELLERLADLALEARHHGLLQVRIALAHDLVHDSSLQVMINPLEDGDPPPSAKAGGQAKSRLRKCPLIPLRIDAARLRLGYTLRAPSVWIRGVGRETSCRREVLSALPPAPSRPFLSPARTPSTGTATSPASEAEHSLEPRRPGILTITY